MDPTGAGQRRWSIRWKPALNAFDIAFDGRLCNSFRYAGRQRLRLDGEPVTDLDTPASGGTRVVIWSERARLVGPTPRTHQRQWRTIGHYSWQ